MFARKRRSAVSLPMVVIGGINAETIPLFRGSGIDGVAVVSAITAAGISPRPAI